MEILLIPLGVSLTMVGLILICIMLGVKLNQVSKKMIWWRNEALKANGNLRLRELWKQHKTRAPWLRTRR